MNKILNIIIGCFTCFSLFSCSEDLPTDEHLPSSKETINNITITWNEGITENQRQQVRNLVKDMVLVEGGTFTMGSNTAYDSDARANEIPAHLVKLTNFYIMAHEMTKDQAVQIYLAKDKAQILDYFSYYTWKHVLSILSSYSNVKFTFPTEAQWEYAALGGQKSKGYIYPGSDNRTNIWTSSETAGSTTPNELGLYNMADQYGEWCLDLYSDYTNDKILVNPCYQSETSSLKEERVVRGGCYFSSSSYNKWNSNTISTYFAYGISKISTQQSSYDKRMCRTKSRAYAYSLESDVNYLVCCRPVINIE